jgi:hypothetical protein
MLLSPALCVRGGTNLWARLLWPSLATGPGDINQPPITIVALSSNGLVRRHTITRHCYRLVIVATGYAVMSPTSISTEGHNSDGRFDDITEGPL